MNRSTTMNRVTAVALATFVVLALAAIPAMAQRHESRRGRPMGPCGPGGGVDVAGMVLRHVDLSDDQRDAIRDVVYSTREGRTDADRQAFRTARHEMVEVLWSPDATEADVQAVAARLAAVEQARVLEQFRMTRAILAQLTAAQQAQLQEFLAKPPEPRDGCRFGGPDDAP